MASQVLQPTQGPIFGLPTQCSWFDLVVKVSVVQKICIFFKQNFMDWIICKFDETIVSSKDGWEFIAQVMHAHVASRRVLLVCPPLQGDEERLQNLIDEAKNSPLRTQLLQQENNSLAILWQKSDDEDSVQDGFNYWMQHYMSLFNELGMDTSALVATTDKQNTIHASIREALQQVEKYLLGISLTKEASPKIIARVLSAARYTFFL